jgi:hypothetical protein
MIRKKELLILENAALRLEFDSEAGTLRSAVNRLTDERYDISGDEFTIETVAFCRSQTDMPLRGFTATNENIEALYTDSDLSVKVTYQLNPADHFFQKHLEITFVRDEALKRVVVSRPILGRNGLEIICYRHPDYEWVSDYVYARHGQNFHRAPDTIPTRTFFGRTDTGGFFTGLEMPFDNSSVSHGKVVMGYAPNIKVRANELLRSESMYFGVYGRGACDDRVSEWRPIPAGEIIRQSEGSGFDGAEAAGLAANANRAKNASSETQGPLPLPSESAAMSAMASVILGPPRHGMMAFANGWHGQMEQDECDSDEKLESELRSLEFVASCGLDGVTDSHPWGGESRKMAELGEGDRYTLGPRVRRFLKRARELGLMVTQWPTMNNSHPWRDYGRAFRLDKPGWLRGVEGEAHRRAGGRDFERLEANCLGNAPFYEWFERIVLDDALGTDFYDSWCIDGDFWGTGAYFHTTVPVTCMAEDHDHLPGDSNYACQSRLDQMIAAVRRRRPDTYIWMCRPPMDLGVWAQRNVDACFTLIESGTGSSNVAAGNEVRTASRIRVHHHFFPHWLDSSLLFPSFANPDRQPEWPSEKIDYLMLSALSCTPNLLLYMPTKTGIPESDKAEIRKWLAWGRDNVEYLFVRHDLFDWPCKGAVDGSAHLLGDHGLVFLFNPDAEEGMADFVLNSESTGFTGERPVTLIQEYPQGDWCVTREPGTTVSVPVPGEAVLVLRILAGKDARGV